MSNLNLNEYLPYVFLLIGLALIGFAAFARSINSDLKQTGILVEGIIFEQDNGSITFSFGDTTNNSSSVNDKVSVRFVTLEKQEWITAPIDQGFQFFYSGQYKNGERVNVYYDKNNPYNFYIDTKQSELIGKILFAIIGIIFLIIGLYRLFV